MNAMKTPTALRGQSIYVVMLMISAIALAIVMFFPVYEYVAFGYRGPLPTPPSKPALPPAQASQPKAVPAEKPATPATATPEEPTGAPEPAKEESKPVSKLDTRSSVAYTVTVATSTTRSTAR